MEIVPRQTIIATRKCYGCGAEVDIKSNKNGIGYYFCHCTDHHKFSREQTGKFVETLIANQGKTPQENTPNAPKTPDPARPRPAPNAGGDDGRSSWTF